MMQQFLLDNFQRYHKRGIEAYRKGDLATARRSLLKAAELLFTLAAKSQGQLQRMRKEKAFRLLEMAKSIDSKAAKQMAGRKLKTTDQEDQHEAAGDKWIVGDVPDVRIADVAGLEEVKSIIRKRVIYPFEHPEITRKYKKQIGGGVLLYGPPGTGKTMIAKAIANEINATFFSVKCSDIMSKWVGAAERNLKRLFDATREHPRAVIFMDETEAIVAKRGGDSTVMNRVIPEFLAQVDGIQGKHRGLLLLGATNRPWDIDEAALRPGRFGELIYVPLPDLAARRQIIAAALSGIPLASDIDIDKIAAETDGLSGADLLALCESAKDGPYEREIASGIANQLESQDITTALKKVRPSVSSSQLARYEKFRQGAGRH